MKRILLFLLAASSVAHAQTTSITVLADTNRAVRTNFTIGNAQVTGLSGLLDQKLGLNGNGSGVTNLNPANLSSAVSIFRGGTGATNASDARSNLGLGSAATNPSSAFQPASSALTNLASGDGSSLTNISGASNPTGNGGSLTNLSASNIVGTVALASGGTGGTNAASALAALLPSYTSNSGKVLSVATNEVSVEWITASGGGSGLPETPLAISNGGSGANDVVGVLSNYNLVRGSSVTLGTAVTNAGTDSVAIGANARSRNTDAIAVGRDAFVFTNRGVAIGAIATVATTNSQGVAIGYDSYSERGVAIGYHAESLVYSGANNFYAVAIGYNASAYDNACAVGYEAIGYAGGAAIGDRAISDTGFAGGFKAEAWGAGGVQLATGTNNDANTIQFLSAGTVDTDEWARLASLSTYPTTNISVTGTNNTNTLVFSNGILVEVQ